MATKDWITQGIGANPGSLLYWLNGGLGSGAAEVINPRWEFSFGAGGRVVDSASGGRVIVTPPGNRVIDSEG